jgi:uncharacterized membrane protein YphA (DoxX/SURF4 family)
MSRLFTSILRLFVTAVFVVSGALKLQDPSRFLLDVQSFELLPYWAAYATALALPWLELLCAVALWRPSLARAGAFLLGLATAGFIAGLGLATARGLELDCGCFGDWLVFPNLGVHVAFNIALLAACGWLMKVSGPKNNAS